NVSAPINVLPLPRVFYLRPAPVREHFVFVQGWIVANTDGAPPLSRSVRQGGVFDFPEAYSLKPEAGNRKSTTATQSAQTELAAGCGSAGKCRTSAFPCSRSGPGCYRVGSLAIC